jgi:hypothetical protein
LISYILKTKKMKPNFIIAALALLSFTFLLSNAKEQSPEAMSYQAVIRNSSNALVTNTEVGMQISILQGSASGTAVYVETQTPTTNAYGLISIEIGGNDAIVVTGSFTSIDWTSGPYFIKTETDPTGGTSYTITGTSQLLSVPYALHANTADSITGIVTSYSVGDIAQGGVVFWVDETGQHGLVCPLEDLSPGTRWYAGTNGYTRAKGNGPFAGEANTSIIIAAHVAIGDDGASYAAYECSGLEITIGDKAYGDWYLPSLEELYLMYQNKETIDAITVTYSGNAFASTSYWSSNEQDDTTAWLLNFGTGILDFSDKSNAYKIRPIRAF